MPDKRDGYYDAQQSVDVETGMECIFYKEHQNDTVWWVDYQNTDGDLAITFDRKKIFHLFSDYPDKLTAEQKRIFDEENPYWKDFFKDRQ